MKGLAIHLDPESCAYIREGVGEALTGENVGYVWSPEIDLTSRGRRTFLDAEDHRRIADMRGNFPSCATLDPPHAWTLIARKSGELGDRPLGDGTWVCIGESKGAVPMMHGFEQLDGGVVPNKWLNKGCGELRAAEGVEERLAAKGNPGQQNRSRMQCQQNLHHALARVEQAASKDRKQEFTSLWHHVYDIDRL